MVLDEKLKSLAERQWSEHFLSPTHTKSTSLVAEASFDYQASTFDGMRAALKRKIDYARRAACGKTINYTANNVTRGEWWRDVKNAMHSSLRVI